MNEHKLRTVEPGTDIWLVAAQTGKLWEGLGIIEGNQNCFLTIEEVDKEYERMRAEGEDVRILSLKLCVT